MPQMARICRRAVATADGRSDTVDMQSSRFAGIRLGLCSALAGVGLLAACGSSGPSAVMVCENVGYAASRVVLGFDHVPFPVDRPGTIRVCVRHVCSTYDYAKPPRGPIRVGIDRAKHAARFAVTVAIRTRAGIVFSGSLSVPTVHLHPNGPGCPPTVFQARVVAHGAATLTT